MIDQHGSRASEAKKNKQTNSKLGFGVQIEVQVGERLKGVGKQLRQPDDDATGVEVVFTYALIHYYGLHPIIYRRSTADSTRVHVRSGNGGKVRIVNVLEGCADK
jgi:hypothetical protein